MKPRCNKCNKFCAYSTSDCGTPYGCNYGYDETPEPLDEQYFCKVCKKEEYDKMIKNKDWQKEGKFNCYWWVKPAWFIKAIKKAGFELKKKGVDYSLIKV